MTFSPAAVVVQGDTGSPAPFASVQVTIADPPQGDFYYWSWAQVGAALYEAEAELFSRTQGSITLTLWQPRQLGAGVHADSVRFQLCADSECEQVILDSSIPVTFTVTGSATPLTTFHTTGFGGNLEAKSTDTDARSVTINITAFDIPPAGVYVRFEEQPTEGSPRIVTHTILNQSGFISSRGTGAAVLTATLETPTRLEARRYESQIVISLCFDASCTRPVPATGNTSTPLRYLIYASEGRDFTSQELQLGAKYAAWDSFSQRLYVVQGFSNGNNSVVAVDPATGTSGAPVELPSESSMIALSDDGQFAYIAAAYEGAIYRYRLPGLQPDGVIQLDGFRQPHRIAVAPGAPRTLAVAQRSAGSGELLAIYDDFVRRGPEVGPAASIAWGSSAAEIYAVSPGHGMFGWSVTLAGPAPLPPIPAAPGLGLGSHTLFESGLLYSSTGVVFDPMTQSFRRYLEGVVAGNGSVAIDLPSDRAFRFDGGLRSYTLSSGRERSIVWYEGGLSVSTHQAPVIRWGTNGLAIVTYDGRLVLITGSFVAP